MKNTTQQRAERKVREGVVTSNKMDKTVVVSVSRNVVHPTYKKIIRLRKHYKAHDTDNQCGIGDTVRIMETRPLSATKRWRVTDILEKAK
jgi:small subunit ribosomal protein S17